MLYTEINLNVERRALLCSLMLRSYKFRAKPDRPDPVYAKKLQEVLGGQYGEISVMMQYLFQGWNCRGE